MLKFRALLDDGTVMECDQSPKHFRTTIRWGTSWAHQKGKNFSYIILVISTGYVLKSTVPSVPVGSFYNGGVPEEWVKDWRALSC